MVGSRHSSCSLLRKPPESTRSSQGIIEVNLEDLRKTGASSSGIGFASNNFRQGTGNQGAGRVGLWRRALSVEMPVFAYIWRYNLEMNKNASRPRSVGTHFDRRQISRRP